MHNKNDVLLQVERALSHMLAHDLNNALGAIDVLADMLAEDLNDSTLYIGKIQMAARLARGQVQALRHAVPKPGEGHEMVPVKEVIAAVQLMMGGHGGRVTVNGVHDAIISVPIAVATYLLYHLMTHVAGCVTGNVTCDQVNSTTLQITGAGNIVPATWPTPLWDVVVAAFDLTIQNGANGFVLQWPVAPVV